MKNEHKQTQNVIEHFLKEYERYGADSASMSVVLRDAFAKEEIVQEFTKTQLEVIKALMKGEKAQIEIFHMVLAILINKFK